jgi:hypothetical protein
MDSVEMADEMADIDLGEPHWPDNASGRRLQYEY